MNQFVEKLGDIQQQGNQQGKIPRLDGKYILPDRRILIRDGDIFTLTGHRDKKRTRQLARCSRKELCDLLAWPGCGGYTNEQLSKFSDDELTRMLNPRPRMVFLATWLYTSGCTEAKQLRKLARQAEVL